MSLPKRLIIEYEDGVKEEILFSRLQRPLFQDGASRIIESPKSSGVREQRPNYILLRWKDGWQEVVGADKDQLDLKRYYVLERKEKVGRMTFEAKEEYPYLLRIDRLPKDLDSIVIVGENDSSVYDFRSSEEVQELDFIDFDKAERHFKIDSKDAEQPLEGLLDLMRTEMDRRGLDAGEILATDSEEQRRIFKELSEAVGIYAMERQEDILGFFKLMMGRLDTA